jgi:predicted anti-sigma-YlaC factor YlaD
MTCHNCRSGLQDVLEQPLSALEAVELLSPEQRAHLDNCQACREELHGLVSLHASLGELATSPAIVPDLRARVLAGLSRQDPRPVPAPVSTESGSSLVVLVATLAAFGYWMPAPPELWPLPSLDPWLWGGVLGLSATLCGLSVPPRARPI